MVKLYFGVAAKESERAHVNQLIVRNGKILYTISIVHKIKNDTPILKYTAAKTVRF